MKRLILSAVAVFQIQLGVSLAQDNTLTTAEANEGYSLQFDGTLPSFQKNFVDYIKGNTTNTNLDARWSVDNALHCVILKVGNTYDIRSTKTYGNFEWRMNFRIDGNEGIFYRALPTYDKLYETGVEYAINNYTNETKDAPGAAYDLFAPSPNSYNLYSTPAASKWNSVRIVAIGDSIEHWMNDVKVVGYKVHSPRFWEAYKISKWNANGFLTNTKAGDQSSDYIHEGYLGLQGDHTGKWQIKEMRITTTGACFGPLKPNGTTQCDNSTEIKSAAAGRKVSFSTLSQSPSELALSFNYDIIKSAAIVGLDGKTVSNGMIANDGAKVVFQGAFKSGLHLLRVTTGSGVVTQKLTLP